MKHYLALLCLSSAILSGHAVTLISTNSTWKYFKGNSEASSPNSAWRTNGFADDAWATGPAPFFYENSPASANAYSGNTALTDMSGGYTSVFLRQSFVIADPSQITKLQFTALSDDGFIAWLNGQEIARFNLPAGNVNYNGTASQTLAEPVPLQNVVLSNPQTYLTTGTNVLAIQAFDASLSSGDFLIWANLTGFTNTTWANVGISEFMATNKTSVVDADGDHSPWIELYNPTTNDVSLNGWSLTADTNDLRQWVIPNIVIEAGSFIEVFASGKNRADPIAELHTSFVPPVNGGFLALVNPATNIVSSLQYPAQQPDVSYGHDPASPNFVGFFPIPTPGDANSLGGANTAPAVDFTRAGGTFLSPFNLQLSAVSNADIHFTLDGTTPTEESPAYATPLSISNSLQVRARAFLPGLMPGPLRSETYLQLQAALANTNSDLPAIVIYNFNGGAVPTNTDQFVNLAIYEPVNGSVRLTNAPTLNARAGINLHGTSTLTIPKHAFSVKFWDELNNDKNYSPLGMPEESSWILYAPDSFDAVLIHNPLIYQLSNEMGRYASRTRFVEVYINTAGGQLVSSNYNGIYVLEEKIKWDDNRVDVAKLRSVDELHPLDNSPTNISGGFLLKIDRLGPGETGFVAAGQTNVYNYPSEQSLKTPQRAPQKQYIQNYMDSFGVALNGPDYTNPVTGYRAFVDVPSWIDSHLLNAITFNVDGLRHSAYFYKDRNDKLHFGPIWDFDRSQGSRDGRDYNPRLWRSTIGDFASDYFGYIWWGRMFTDIDFWQAWIDRYQELRAGIFSTNHLFGAIDTLVAQVRQQQPREVARWPTLTNPRSGNVSGSGYSNVFPGTYQGEVDFLKKWYIDRFRFMDTNFLSRPLFTPGNGVFLANGNLTIASPDGGTIYYTTNSTDPRLPGGSISSNALVYSGPLALSPNLTITARVFDLSHYNLTGTNKPPLNSPWSGVIQSTFVLAAPPVITQSPFDLDAYLGQNPTFTVQTLGSPAPGYQWFLNGAPLLNQTNAQLTLSLTQTNQAGDYSIVVTNVVGTNSAMFHLNLTPKPILAITEVLSSESRGTNNSTLDHQDWWELSNFGSFPVNLRGFRFDDSGASLVNAEAITNSALIMPGESVVFVQDMTPGQFRQWWGSTNLPASLQILAYPNIGFSANGDSLYLWNAAASSGTDFVAKATFPTAVRGVSFGYDPGSNTFGALSIPGQNGAFNAAINGDVGSPGTLINLPRLAHLDFNAVNGVSFNFAAQPGRKYEIQYKDDLSSPNWIVLTNFNADSNSTLFMDPAAATNSTRFYRVVIVP